MVEATRTGRCAWRCQRTAPLAASMTTAAFASTRGPGGEAAAAGVAIHPATRPSARTRDGNHRWREHAGRLHEPVEEVQHPRPGRGAAAGGAPDAAAGSDGRRRRVIAGSSPPVLRPTRGSGCEDLGRRPFDRFHRTLRRYVQGWHNLVEFAHGLDCLGPLVRAARADRLLRPPLPLGLCVLHPPAPGSGRGRPAAGGLALLALELVNERGTPGKTLSQEIPVLAQLEPDHFSPPRRETWPSTLLPAMEALKVAGSWAGQGRGPLRRGRPPGLLPRPARPVDPPTLADLAAETGLDRALPGRLRRRRPPPRRGRGLAEGRRPRRGGLAPRLPARRHGRLQPRHRHHRLGPRHPRAPRGRRARHRRPPRPGLPPNRGP